MANHKNYAGKRPLGRVLRIGYLAALAGLAVALPGCFHDDDDDNGGSGGDGGGNGQGASLRVIHAAPDAPPVDVLLDDSTVVSDLDYGEGTAFSDLSAGAYDVSIEATTPGGDQTLVDLPATTFDAATDYTIIATGLVAGDTFEPLVLSNAQADVTAGQARVQVVHAAPGAPEVAIYVTAPGADLASSTALGTLAFGNSLERTEVAAGSYQIRATAAGDPASVVYDSGPVDLAAGSDLLLVAVDNTGAGPSPISLVLNNGTEQSDLLDVGTTAEIRAGFLSPDAPAVDVGFNGNLATPAFDAATYPGLSAYTGVAPGAYDLSFVDDATQANTYFTSNVPTAAGESYTVLAVGPLASIEPLVLTDDVRSIGTEVRLRVVHAAPSAGNVDIYVAPTGTDINTVSPTYANVAFKDVQDFSGYAAGNYDVTVVPAGTKAPVAASASLATANGDVNTLIVREAVGGGAPYELLVEDETD